MSKSLTVYPEKCNSCRACELACSFAKTGVFSPASSCIQVNLFAEAAFFVPITCTQCADAWCLHACPSRAIARDVETGAVLVNPQRCVGCKMCTMACPFGTIAVSKKTEKAVKCDLCSGDPACVGICPTGALVFEEQDNPLRLKRQDTAAKIAESYKEVSQ